MQFLPTVSLALLLIWNISLAHAVPIVFSSGTYTTSVQADAGAEGAGPRTAFSTGMLPISSAASAASADGDLASGVSFADTLFLTTTTDALSVADSAAATSVATFTGRFNAVPGLLNLSLMFDALTDQIGTGFSLNSLAVTLEVNGTSIFNELLTETRAINESFLLADGGIGLLDLTLIGTSDAAVPGDYAFSLATLDAALDAPVAVVPEPASIALLLAGLSGFALSQRRLKRRLAK